MKLMGLFGYDKDKVFVMDIPDLDFYIQSIIVLDESTNALNNHGYNLIMKRGELS